MLRGGWDKTAKLWDAATPVALALQLKESDGDAARTRSSGSMPGFPLPEVESLSIVASGLKFSDDGSLVAVDMERRSQLTRQLEGLAQSPIPNVRFLRWFFGTGSDRTIFPASDVKVVEWVDNALLTNPNLAEQWLRNALVFLPDHPLLHIALAGLETDSKRPAFLCAFALRRRPTHSVFSTRASEGPRAQ